MKNYTFLIAIIAILFLTNCQSNNAKKAEDVGQEEAQQMLEEAKTVASVWKIHEEMASEYGDETRDGKATFYEDGTLNINDGVVDITYNFEYSDEKASIKLTNVEMEEDVLNFVITAETDNSQTWENIENDVQSIWTFTKE